MQSKDRVLEAFMNYQNYITNHFHAKIKILRTDNGGEYTGNAFKDHLAKHGILHQTTCPYTPQQNGVSERKNRHLMEVARSMMFHTNVPKRFWGDAVLSACYLINRLPTKILGDISPYEVLNKTPPLVNHLRVFGCLCFVFVPDGQRNKLDPKSIRAMFIGYSHTQKGYKCYVPQTQRVMVSRDVKFIEDKGYYEEKSWSDLEDLSNSASDRATNLRNILDGLGIHSITTACPLTSGRSPSTSSHHSSEQSTAATPIRESSPIDPTESSHSRAKSQEHSTTRTRAPEHSSSLNDALLHLDPEGGRSEDMDIDTVSSTSAGTCPSEVHDQGGPNEEAPQALRRSTRIRIDPSNWVNTRVYYKRRQLLILLRPCVPLQYFLWSTKLS